MHDMPTQRRLFDMKSAIAATAISFDIVYSSENVMSGPTAMEMDRRAVSSRYGRVYISTLARLVASADSR